MNITSIKGGALRRAVIAKESVKAVACRHLNAFHDGHSFAHMAYFGAVAVEGHGVYAMMGGVMLVLGVISWMLSEDF